MLRTLGKTTWDKIKINEVFAYDFFDNGLWDIAVKINKKKAMTLDYNFSFKFNGNLTGCYHAVERTLYKLKKSNQKLWKEE